MVTQRSILAHADLSRGSPGTAAARGRNGGTPRAERRLAACGTAAARGRKAAGRGRRAERRLAAGGTAAPRVRLRPGLPKRRPPLLACAGDPVARVRCRRPSRSGGVCRVTPLLASTVAICRAVWHGWAAGCCSSSPLAGCFGRARRARPNRWRWWAPHCSSRNSAGTTTAFGTGHLEQRGHQDRVRHRPFGTARAPGPRSGPAIWNSAGTRTAFGIGHLEQRGHHDRVRVGPRAWSRSLPVARTSAR
jgi:hypothetical protein